jgi:hypothetical protein
MTTSLNAAVRAAVKADFRQVDGDGTQELTVTAEGDIALTNGTGANQADLIFHDNRTIALSSSENLDLSGALTDPFGNVIAFAKIKAIIIRAAAANVNDVLVGGAATNTFLGMFGDATDIIKVKPAGAFVWVAPGTGATVTAATGDILKVANSGAGTSVTYDVTIIGTSV